MSDLGLRQLRAANIARTNEMGFPLDAWNPLEWAGAMAGEAGEACNFAKKINRRELGVGVFNDASIEELREALAKELADVIIYADLLSASLGIDLAQALAKKFNEKSEEYGMPQRLPVPED